VKFITFLNRNNTEHVGLITDKDEIIDVTTLGKSYSFYKSVLDIIRGEEEALDTLNELLQFVPEEMKFKNTDEIKILAPIPNPSRNIYCVGLNYAKHTEEFSKGKEDATDYPIIFSKVPTTVIGPEADINSHANVTSEVDYEAELGVIIGKGGRDIPKDEVFDYVFGYTIINDVTARDLQRMHKQWLLGKSLDTFCPMGPYIIHKSEIDHPENLNISCMVNEEVRQSSNTKHMIFDIPEIISTISKGHTLQAGDIIATGTCEGVGMGFEPPKYLKKGDVVEVEIEKIGILRNTVS